MSGWLVLCGLLAGCAPDAKPLVPVAADFPAGTADSADADSGDPVSVQREGTTLRVQIDGDMPGLAVNLHTVVLGATSDAPLELADGVRDGETFEIAVDPPDDRWITDLDADTRGFLALPFAYIDDDANGVHTPEEQYVGLALQGALYVDGEPGPDLASLGMAAGWNAVAVDLETTNLTVYAGGLEALVLAPQLVPQDRFVLEAVFALPLDGQRVALVPETVTSGAVTGPILFDQAASGTVQVPVDGPPPDEHLQDLGADGTQYRDWQYGVESVVVYTDDDASGGYTASDAVVGTLCALGASARLQHTSEADKAFEALHLATNHIIPAWSLYLELPDGPRYMRIDDVGPLSLEGSCAP